MSGTNLNFSNVELKRAYEAAADERDSLIKNRITGAQKRLNTLLENQETDVLLVVAQFENELSQLNVIWEQSISDYTVKVNAVKENILQKHDFEIADLCDKNAKRLPPKFSKNLLNMRKIEETLVKQQKFDEALKVKGRADEIELQETEKHEADERTSLARKIKQLKQRHTTELQILNEKISSTRKRQQQIRIQDVTHLAQRYENCLTDLESQHNIMRKKVENFFDKKSFARDAPNFNLKGVSSDVLAAKALALVKAVIAAIKPNNGVVPEQLITQMRLFSGEAATRVVANLTSGNLTSHHLHSGSEAFSADNGESELTDAHHSNSPRNSTTTTTTTTVVNISISENSNNAAAGAPSSPRSPGQGAKPQSGAAVPSGNALSPRPASPKSASPHVIQQLNYSYQPTHSAALQQTPIHYYQQHPQLSHVRRSLSPLSDRLLPAQPAQATPAAVGSAWEPVRRQTVSQSVLAASSSATPTAASRAAPQSSVATPTQQHSAYVGQATAQVGVGGTGTGITAPMSTPGAATYPYGGLATGRMSTGFPGATPASTPTAGVVPPAAGALPFYAGAGGVFASPAAPTPSFPNPFQMYPASPFFY